MVSFVQLIVIIRQIVMVMVFVMSMINTMYLITREASCQCVKNYYGDSCEKECNEATDCSGNGMCLHNGKCMCNEGFSGNHCETKSSIRVSSDLIFVIILFVALIIQLYLFYRQMVLFIIYSSYLEKAPICGKIVNIDYTN